MLSKECKLRFKNRDEEKRRKEGRNWHVEKLAYEDHRDLH
jgi:hypothetical protein